MASTATNRLLKAFGGALTKAGAVAGFSAAQGAVKRTVPRAAPWVRIGTAVVGFAGKVFTDPNKSPVVHGASDALMASAIAAPAEEFGGEMAAGLLTLREQEEQEQAAYVEDARAHYVGQDLINDPATRPR